MTAKTKILSAQRLRNIRRLLGGTQYKDGALTPLAGDASFRRYIRIRTPRGCAMLMDAPPKKEDVRPYIATATYLKGHGYSAPSVLACNQAAGLLLLEDLGDDTFTRLLKGAKPAARKILERKLYTAAVDLLAAWHGNHHEFVNPKRLPLPLYDETLLLNEIRLFSDWYLPQVLGKNKAKTLRADYMALWREILEAAPLQADQWVHRDYHADNLMWLPKRKGLARVGLLDFQDAVYGDAAYDLASLLKDARRDVPASLSDAMLERYIAATGTDARRFMAAYAVLAAQRNSKIIGIFTRLAARDGKSAYLNYLPRVWRHLEHDLAHPAFSRLKQWIDAYVGTQARGVIAVRHDSHDLALTA